MEPGNGREIAPARERLRAMLAAVSHRGPDDTGAAYFGFGAAGASHPGQSGPKETADPSRHGNLALGHQRLSILDLSAAGHQPMFGDDRETCLILNGEIYNYLELRAELSRDRKFRTESDTEVLLAAYRKWGVAMLPRLDGMFAFAIWDARAGKLVCARDPLGIKPFYYSSSGERFLFGSEPRAVLAGLGSSGHLDRARTSEFLVLGVSDHDDGTCYEEIRQLRGGHWIEVDGDGRVSEPRAFWTPSVAPAAAPPDVAEAVREQIDLAVCRQMRSDVPVGGCLSGGVDSGSLVASVGRLLGKGAGEFRALTLTVDGFEGDEAEMAEIMAGSAGVRWVRVEVEGRRASLEKDLENLVRAMGEPFATLSMLAQYKLMERARAEGLKVMLDGQGGDEVFVGYPTTAQRIVRDSLRGGRIGAALHEWLALRENSSVPLSRSLLGNVFFSSPRLASFRNGRRLRGVVATDLVGATRRSVVEDLFQDGDMAATQVRELTRYILPQLLRYEDRNSMAFGLESRVPLLAVGLVDLALSLPAEWKVRDGWTKFALRTAMRDRVPERILWNRRKRGFEVPQRRWLSELMPAIHGWLKELPQGSPVDGAAILERLETTGQSAWLSRCLSVALWMRFSGVSA
jgi:asparagine synthase (glutamine-hydrolysing)